MKIRTFYYRITKQTRRFKLIRIDGPPPATPHIGDYETVDILAIIAENGNKVVILPNRKSSRVTY